MRPPTGSPVRERAVIAAAAAIGVEVLLFERYGAHEASFHWFTHLYVGGAAALLVLSGLTLLRRRESPYPAVWVVVGHVAALVPDLLYTLRDMAHRPWMDIFLGHLSTHFVPGRNATWFAVFTLAVAAYVLNVERLGGAAHRGPA